MLTPYTGSNQTPISDNCEALVEMRHSIEHLWSINNCSLGAICYEFKNINPFHGTCRMGPILLRWINFNLGMEKLLHPLLNVGWNYITIPNTNGSTVNVWEWTSYFTPALLHTLLLIHAGVKVNPWKWKGTLVSIAGTLILVSGHFRRVTSGYFRISQQ